MTDTRSLSVIARDIRTHWVKKDGTPNVNYAAKPYLDAMASLHSVNDMYGYDSAKSIVLYFLGNARAFTGPEAKRIKAELKSLIK